MSNRSFLGLVPALLLCLLAGTAVVWLLSAPSRPSTASQPSSQIVTPLSDSAQREHRERFFGGDPERDVRGGQEVKPRW